MARSVSLIQLANLATLPVLGSVAGTKFWRESRALTRAARAPLGKRRANQLRSLNELLTGAASKVPMLRERLDPRVLAHGLRDLEELQELPVTRKADLMAGFPDLVVNSELDHSDWQYVSTSGTVSRVVTVKNFARRDRERAAALHGLRQGAGYRPGLRFVQIPPNICNIVCGEGATNETESFRIELGRFLKATARNQPSDLSDLRGAFERRIVYRTRILSPLAPSGTQLAPQRLEEFWNRIRAEKPFLLHALPEYLQLLAEWAIADGRPPLGVPRVIPMGGATTPFMRRRIVAGLGGTFTDFYGTAELGPVAFEKEPGDGLRPIMELFLLEVVRHGRAAEPGEIGRLLITDLTNHAMPFLRYEVGDVAVWWPPSEASNDQSPRLRIVGRLDEILEDASGGPLAPETLRDRLLDEADCLAFSIRERAGRRLQIDYVPRHEDRGGDRVVGAIEPLLHESYRIKARPVGNVPAEPSGKFRSIRAQPGGAALVEAESSPPPALAAEGQQ